ncbi:Ig-like domain-containing protein [Pseudomonas entomophila]|uniref:Ig-like domain-containing protein n=1 Tax=Pseudomonas entomophila TaxID=312306 RepID=UPI0023D81918|nr:Ig-like domain-containing protein [Pseudomonas entomophila]MDF0732958.1 Ig-like domain-containing protein [Pseudomonas entomophila]
MDLNEFNKMFGDENSDPTPPTPVVIPPSDFDPRDLPEDGESVLMFSSSETEQKPRLLGTVDEFNRLLEPGIGSMGFEINAILPPFPAGARAPVVGAHFGLNRAAVHVNPSKGLPVTLQAYNNMHAGDMIEVFWQLVGTPTPIAVLTVVVTPEQADSRADISAHIPIERVVVGFGEWYARITRSPSGNQEESRKLTVFYKDTLPGGPDRRPNEPWHSELHAALLELPPALTPGLQIPVTIDAYPLMRVRDVITLSVGGVYFTHTLAEGEVDNQVTFLIAADQLEPIKELDSVLVVWRVHDEVENYSEKWSGELLLTPELDDENLAEAPELLIPIGDVIVEGRLALEDLGSQDLHARVYVMRPIFQLNDVLRFRYAVTTVEGQRFEVTLPDIVIQREPDAPFPGFRLVAVANADVVRAANGQLRVSYEVYRGGARVWRSYRRTLVVQGIVQRLPAPSVNEARGGLLPNDLKAITAKIGWPGMALGDRTQLVLSGRSASGTIERTVPLARVSQNEAIQGSMDRYVAEQFGRLNGGTLTVSYEVGQPGAGGQSSAPLHLLVGEQVELLPAPVVGGVEDSLLFPRSPSTTVNIPLGVLKDDDFVTLTWIGRTAAATFTETQQADSGWPMSFSVPEAVVRAGLRQAIQVFYTVRSRTGVQLSSSVTLIVADAATPWDRRAPVSLEAQGAALDPARIPLNPGATFFVEFQGMLPLSQLRLVLDSPVAGQGYVSETQTVDQVGRMTFHVPRSVVLANIGRKIIVRYQRKRHGQETFEFSNPLALTVSPALSIDRRDMVLNGTAFKLAAPRTGLDSIGNTAVRVPTGGQAPYTYSSSDERVAVVTAQGKVTGERNGNATITVRDASGQAVSYLVNVSNVFGVYIFSEALTPTGYIDLAVRTPRAIYTNSSHWNDLRRVYTQVFPQRTWVSWDANNGGAITYWDPNTNSPMQFRPPQNHRYIPAYAVLRNVGMA